MLLATGVCDNLAAVTPCSIMTLGCDFDITQLVDSNLGYHVCCYKVRLKPHYAMVPCMYACSHVGMVAGAAQSMTCGLICNAQFVGGDPRYTDKCKRYNPPTFLPPGPGAGGKCKSESPLAVAGRRASVSARIRMLHANVQVLSCTSVCLLQRSRTATTTTARARAMARDMAMAATTRAVTVAM